MMGKFNLSVSGLPLVQNLSTLVRLALCRPGTIAILKESPFNAGMSRGQWGMGLEAM